MRRGRRNGVFLSISPVIIHATLQIKQPISVDVCKNTPEHAFLCKHGGLHRTPSFGTSSLYLWQSNNNDCQDDRSASSQPRLEARRLHLRPGLPAGNLLPTRHLSFHIAVLYPTPVSSARHLMPPPPPSRRPNRTRPAQLRTEASDAPSSNFTELQVSSSVKVVFSAT